MSLLAPLFFLGALAIGLPVIFHLIRRQPRGKIQFSSLMFLEASPPRISRRSRLDNWFLLLLRGLALLLIAAAFARPFLRTSAATALAPVERMVVILVDRSASMQRGDLWQQTLARVGEVADALKPTDHVALATFDTRFEVLRGFDEGAGIEAAVVPAALGELVPTWRAGDLGGALVAAADLIEAASRNVDSSEVERTVILVSDMQAGSSLAGLRGYEWPQGTRVEIERIGSEESTNATVRLAGRGAVEEAVEEEGEGEMFRVQVSNAADSSTGRFSIRWIDAAGNSLGDSATTITAPPGSHRATRIPAPPENAVAIELTGDDHPFDNRHFVALPDSIEQTVWFVGRDVEDPRQSLLYYLQRVSLDRPGKTVGVRAARSLEELDVDGTFGAVTPRRVPLVIVAGPPPSETLTQLERYVAAGGRVLVVVDSSTAGDAAIEPAIRGLSGDPSLSIAAADVSDYALMARIDFGSRLFEPLADPRFSDFSKIQFWKHQRVETEEQDRWQVLARFDDGDAALLQRDVGAGRLWLLAAGWQPTESQLALSTKFVPLIAGMVRDGDRDEAPDRAVVGEPLPFPPSESAVIETPDERRIDYRSTADTAELAIPGIYRYRDGETEKAIALNVDAAESQTEPLDRLMLEQMGVRFVDQEQDERLAQAERKMRDAELENRQQWWRVLLLAALGMIGLETLLSSRTRATAPADSAAVGT